MTKALTTIAAKTLLFGGVFSLFVGALYARSYEPGITFATSGIDLRIDSTAYYNGLAVPGSTWDLKDLVPTSDHFFDLDDVKPGDSGEVTISLHVKKSKAFMCLDFKNLKDDENTINEPESHEDGNGSASGELGEGLEFFGWLDDGDDVFEVGEQPLFGTTTQSAGVVLNETTYPVADTSQGGSCQINGVRYVGISWCAGDLVVDVPTATITCNGTVLGNEAQTDSLSVDVSIRAVPDNGKGTFFCGGGSGGGQCSHGFWKNHLDIWYDKNNPADVQLLNDLNAKGPGSDVIREAARVALQTEFPNVKCDEDDGGHDDDDDEEEPPKPPKPPKECKWPIPQSVCRVLERINR